MPAAAMRPIAWSSSVLLPMPGSPPSSVTEPGDEPAAEHAVQLGHPGGPARGGDRIDLGQGHHDAGGGGRPVRDRRRALLHQATTTRRTRCSGRATSAPGRRTRCSGRPGAPWTVTNTCSGHAGTLPAGCDHPVGRPQDRRVGAAVRGRRSPPSRAARRPGCCRATASLAVPPGLSKNMIRVPVSDAVPPVAGSVLGSVLE